MVCVNELHSCPQPAWMAVQKRASCAGDAYCYYKQYSSRSMQNMLFIMAEIPNEQATDIFFIIEDDSRCPPDPFKVQV